MDTGEGMQSCIGEGKLTHRTCNATAPSVLSLFVNRSVGNSWRAARDRKPGSGHFIYSNAWCVLSEHVSNALQKLKLGPAQRVT